MAVSTNLDCHLFVHPSFSLDQLAMLLSSILPGTLSQGPGTRTLQTAHGEMDVLKNPDFDPTKSRYFPDGFLFFPYSIEFYPYPGHSLQARVDMLTKVLESFWAQGIPAVAACDYEEMLPRGGGNKDPNLPWPSNQEVFPKPDTNSETALGTKDVRFPV